MITIFNVLILLALIVVYFYLDNRWQYYYLDLHAFANIVHIGAHDPGIRGNLPFRAERVTRAPRRVTPPPLPKNLGIIKDMAYNVGKNGKIVVEYYFLHYSLSGYCHIAVQRNMELIDLIEPSYEVCIASCEAFHLLSVEAHLRKS